MKNNSIEQEIVGIYSEIDSNSNLYKNSIKPIKLVLGSILNSLSKNKEIDSRTLRAYKDICVLVVKNFEDSALEIKFINLKKILTKEYPEFKDLKILGKEWGLQNPF